MDLAALAHPLRRVALVGDAHLEGRVAQQAPDDRGADRAGAAGDEDAAHPAAPRRRPRRPRALRPRRRRRTPARRPSSSRGPRPGSPARARSAIARSVAGLAELRVVGGHDTASAPATRLARATRSASARAGRARRRRPARARAAGSACARASRARRRCRALKARPSTATLRRSASEPSRRLMPSTRNSGTDSLTRETASSMPGRRRALLGEREVLAQAGAGGQAGLGDAAARVVAVDQVDHLEHVRAVALAVHHQQVGQREVRVAQDVRPDLRQLGLHRRGLDDRRAEDARTARPRPRPSARRRRR